MKYQVLVNYYTEGHSFMDGEFDTVDEAVKKAMGYTNGSPFLIVQIVDWRAICTNP